MIVIDKEAVSVRQYDTNEENLIHLEVLVSSDQGEGSEWTEDWGINNDGSIYSPYNTYKNFDEFKTDF